MQKVCGAQISGILYRYFKGRNHPAKLRLWTVLRRLMGYKRLRVPYEGGWITVNDEDKVQYSFLSSGGYEKEVWEALRPYVRPGDVVWDVGAHIGGFTLSAGFTRGVGQVVSFEPNPTLFKILCFHRALNAVAGQAFSYALSDASRRQRLRLAPADNLGQSSLVLSDKGDSVEVECRTVDELVYGMGVPAPDLMKIDVEGWEMHVLRGAERLFKERPPKALVYEDETKSDGSAVGPDIARFLTARGYSIQRIHRPTGEIKENENYLALLTAS